MDGYGWLSVVSIVDMWPVCVCVFSGDGTLPTRLLAFMGFWVALTAEDGSLIEWHVLAHLVLISFVASPISWLVWLEFYFFNFCFVIFLGAIVSVHLIRFLNFTFLSNSCSSWQTSFLILWEKLLSLSEVGRRGVWAATHAYKRAISSLFWWWLFIMK